jgi:hypothetical protein
VESVYSFRSCFKLELSQKAGTLERQMSFIFWEYVCVCMCVQEIKVLIFICVLLERN